MMVDKLNTDFLSDQYAYARVGVLALRLSVETTGARNGFFRRVERDDFAIARPVVTVTLMECPT
jgi:hypothetical protein